MRELHTLRFSPRLSGTLKCPSLPSSFHYHQIIFLEFTHARGPISFQSAQIFFLTSLSLLDLFSICWFFPSGCQLWTSSPPTLSRISFFRNGIQLEMQRVWGGFFHSQAGITLTGQKEFIIQWSIPPPMPQEYETVTKRNLQMPAEGFLLHIYMFTTFRWRRKCSCSLETGNRHILRSDIH